MRTATQVALSVGPGGAGAFWSGAMRCPKCRSDMELLDVDGVQVDRCLSCQGLWFDDGELELLRDSKIGAELDTGDLEVGRTHNSVESYRCPRCGGEMQTTVDPKQRHIGFEQCEDCNGSYFDAGEFSDLATHWSPSCRWLSVPNLHPR